MQNRRIWLGEWGNCLIGSSAHDGLIFSIARIAMNQNLISGNVDHPVFDDLSPGIKIGVHTPVELHSRIGDFNYEKKVARLGSSSVFPD